jgi:cytochrome c5
MINYLMKGNMIKILLLAVFIFTAGYAVLASGSGENVFNSKCGTCHSLELALSKSYSRDKWVDTIKRMKSYGLDISRGETKEAAAYLASGRK